jgi:hypothetical protein
MQFSGDFYNAAGQQGVARATFAPLKDGRVHQHIEHSTDAGETWTVYFDGYYQRKESPSESPLESPSESQPESPPKAGDR